MSKLNKKLRISLQGSNSGRNAGDAAILGSVMKALTDEMKGHVEFEVPTTNVRFVRDTYGEMFNVRPFSIMPWTGSIRLAGIPNFISVARSDMVFIIDGLIFDVKLFNPLFNFLITLIFVVPWAALWGTKVVCYNVGIGPLRSFWGRLFARTIGRLSSLIMVRDEDSLNLFREIGVKKPIYLTADSAFQNWKSSEERVSELLSKEGLVQEARENRLLGVNVTRYVDTWLKAQEKVSSKEEFLPALARALYRLKTESDIVPVLFSTQVMDADYVRKLASLIEDIYLHEQGKKWCPTVFSNETLSSHDIQGLSGKCRLYMGMRVHSVIIASRGGAPVLGLVYAPKVRSFLHQLGTPELAIELIDVAEEGIVRTVRHAWEKSAAIQRKQQDVVLDLERRSTKAASFVRMLWEGEAISEDKDICEYERVVNN